MTLLLLACSNTGSVALGPQDGVPSTDTGAAATDTGEVVTHDPEGDYEGDFEVSVYWDAWDYAATCNDDEVELTVEGSDVEGVASCTFDWEDGGSMTFRVHVTGELDDDHLLDGDATVDLNDYTREDDSGATGDFASDAPRLGGSGEMSAYGEDMEYEWVLDLERR